MPPHLFGMRPEDLVAATRADPDALTLDEARRVLSAAVALGRLDLGGVRPISAKKLAALDRLTRRAPLVVLERVEDPVDQSLRYLFQGEDGTVFEAVRIRLEAADRFTVCLSSQAGCAMACTFCATGRLGLRRDLSPWEIVAQWWTVRAEAPGRVSGAVFMGQGEPLHNYDAVIQAAGVLSCPTGGRIRAESITISTVGLVGPIRRYAAEGHPYRLIVSLSSAVPERRGALLPVAGRQPLAAVTEALAALAERVGRVTVAWVLMGGVNTGDDEIEALAALNRIAPIRLNLIDVNDRREQGYRRATDQERARFLDGLRDAGVPFVRRYSVGYSQNSACGMLAGRAEFTQLAEP